MPQQQKAVAAEPEEGAQSPAAQRVETVIEKMDTATRSAVERANTTERNQCREAMVSKNLIVQTKLVEHVAANEQPAVAETQSGQNSLAPQPIENGL